MNAQLLASMGLPEFGNAFTACPPKSRSTNPVLVKKSHKPTKAQALIISLETPEERKKRQTFNRQIRQRKYQAAYAQTEAGRLSKQRNSLKAKAERVNKHNPDIGQRTEADSDKLGKLTGRSAPNSRDL